MKPPDVKRPGSAPAQPGREGDSPGGRINIKVTGGRPEVQGNRNARNASQPAPAWSDPPGTAAMRMLGNLWGPPRRPLPRRQR